MDTLKYILPEGAACLVCGGGAAGMAGHPLLYRGFRAESSAFSVDIRRGLAAGGGHLAGHRLVAGGQGGTCQSGGRDESGVRR